MTELHTSPLLKRALWVVLPLLGGFSLGIVLLNRTSSHPTNTVSPQPTVAISSPVPQIKVTAAAPGNTKTVQSAQKQPAKAKSAPVNPANLSEQQKAMNREAKSRFLATAGTVDSLIEMKVAIAEGVTSANLGVPGGALLLDQNGKQLQQLPAGASYTVQPNGSGISFGNWQLPTIVWVQPPLGGLFQLGDRTYRGRLALVAHEGNLWGVNAINLRQYLHSVVASEVSPSWHMEALKAQAVAARSYALTYYFKPINQLFHLGATEYYQVYTGIDREAERTKQAVDVTAGQFVSYRGGIVESLYAASDDIVAEAFQGHGMSQLGALNLAEQGHSYMQILSNYYPGTGVSRIQEDYN